ncbi:MAG: ribulose-phosphate 3-epimerase [Coriobacteriia bacterium]|jgi:ribulose-phosphate 3-epimerase
MSIRIAPSLLSADFARLGEEVRAVQDAGADILHFDVMDNHYVPNLTVGPLVCQALKPYARVPIDVHLMVSPVDALIGAFAGAGADWISFHPEATEHIDRSLSLVRDAGCRAGLALNPATPLWHLDHVLDRLDFVLLMSVNPGFGGQSFIPSAIEKARMCRETLDHYETGTGRHIDLEIDGGIKPETIGDVACAGVEVFVAGSAVFGAPEYAQAIAAIRAAADAALLGLTPAGAPPRSGDHERRP